MNAPPLKCRKSANYMMNIVILSPDLTQITSTQKICMHIPKIHHFLVYRNENSEFFYLNI